jgi:hypothetical protein
MSERDNGGPAFPQRFVINGHEQTPSQGDSGMSLRDYYAAEALRECILVAADQTPLNGDVRLSALFEKAAVFAYYAADAMLKERAK